MTRARIDRAVCRDGSTSGLTLIEMLVVVALAALAMLVAAPSLRRPSDGIALRSATAHLLADLKSARSTALATGSDLAVVLDTDQRSYQVGSTGRIRRLPSTLQLAVTAVRSAGADGRPVVVFFSDGSSSGGLISLSLGAQHKRIRIEWLTGVVRQEADAS